MMILLAVMILCCGPVALAFVPANARRYRTCIFDNIEKSLENARKNLTERKSPGAGLATAGKFSFTHFITY